MSEYDNHIILHHLDDPLRILKWTIDEALILIGPIFFGIAADHFVMGMMCAGVGFWGLKKIKQRLGSMGLKHMFYWYLPHNKRQLPTSPPSCKREYLG